jgi:hypothetical protein
MNPCPKCGKRFESQKGLSMHLRDKHRGYFFVRFRLPWLALTLVLALGAVAAFPYLSSPRELPPTLSEKDRLLETYMDGHENLAMHIHPKLRIFVDGAEVKVPANIGIAPDGRMRVIYTHDETGVIHIESPKYTDFTFGDFLKIWGKNLNSTCFDSYCGRIRFTANGVEVADPLNYVLRDEDELVLEVFTR